MKARKTKAQKTRAKAPKKTQPVEAIPHEHAIKKFRFKRQLARDVASQSVPATDSEHEIGLPPVEKSGPKCMVRTKVWLCEKSVTSKRVLGWASTSCNDKDDVGKICHNYATGASSDSITITQEDVIPEVWAVLAENDSVVDPTSITLWN